MISQLHLKNFKSWPDTGAMRFAPLTGFFGVNSSGKTSILQFLMMMKQTTESLDRSRVLHTGGDRDSYVDLGTFYNLVHNHQQPGQIAFAVEWNCEVEFGTKNGNRLRLEATIKGDADAIWAREFIYTISIGEHTVHRTGMERKDGHYHFIDEDLRGSEDIFNIASELSETAASYQPVLDAPLLGPEKCYIFPGYAGSSRYFGNKLADYNNLAAAFERLMKNVFYLGPLREYPNRIYLWSGESPLGVGTRGEWAVSALLAAPLKVREQVASWLRKMGLIYNFKLRPIAKNRREYEVMLQLSLEAAEVSITDVGFGVSQILPVIALCYYAPEESVIILEQPEIHLHPAAQANLADLFIDVIKTRKVQIILESHSEHLLRRLQRRMAEEKLRPEQAALYFTSIQKGVSGMTELDIDAFGNIRNWPANFFGDELGDLAAMTEAAMRRKLNGGGV